MRKVSYTCIICRSTYRLSDMQTNFLVSFVVIDDVKLLPFGLYTR